MRAHLILLFLCVGTMAINKRSLIDWIESQYEEARAGFVQGLKKVNNRSNQPLRNRSGSRKFANKFQDIIPRDVPFPCDTAGPGARSPTRPTSVHKLRPGDIDVVGAMGDSITAANGGAATKMAEVYIENRGISWSIGGEGSWREYLTLPNILREFNPNLVGFSLEDSFGFQCPAQFNVAEPVAVVSDMPFQARLLTRRIRTDSRVNFEKDWKMVTIMIGANDFCSLMCYTKNISATPEMYRRYMTEALDWLRDNLPRTLINLLPPPNLRILQEFTEKPFQCFLSHKVECPCMFGDRWKHRNEEFRSNMTAVQRVVVEIANSGRYSGRDDFAVVLQPFLLYPEVPQTISSVTGAKTTDYNYFSEDCFHFSQKLQALGANSLWNNLMEPVGRKTPSIPSRPFERFLCPTQKHPYIYTAINSR